MSEIWKPITGYEGHYEVSSHGRVRSLKTGRNLSGRECPHILKSIVSVYGYLTVSLSLDGVAKTCAVHRLVATEFVPNPQRVFAVNHIDNDRRNNLPDNLEWCTAAENSVHSAKQGRQRKKLTISQVQCMRRWQGILSADELAMLNNVSLQTVREVWRRVNWRYVA